MSSSNFLRGRARGTTFRGADGRGRGRGGGRGGTGSTSFRPDYRVPQLAFEYNDRCGTITHPAGKCTICDDYRVHLYGPQERREPTFVAARDNQYHAMLAGVAEDLAKADEVIARLEHDIQQLQLENTSLKAAVTSDVDRSRKRLRLDATEPIYQTQVKLVADAIKLAKTFVSDDAGQGEERASPDIIMVYGEDPSKAQFDIMRAPNSLAHLVPAADRVSRLTAADKRSGLREAAVTVAIVEYLADSAPETTIFADPAFPDDLESAKALLRSARTPGNYEAYFLLQAVLWLAEHWEYATNGTISLTPALKHMRTEAAKNFPRWHQSRGRPHEAAQRLLTFSVNHEFRKFKRPDSAGPSATELQIAVWAAGTALPELAPGIHVSDDKGFVDLRTVRGHQMVAALSPDTKKQTMANRNRRRFTLTATHLIACVGLYAELVAEAGVTITPSFSPQPFPVEKVDNLDVRELACFFAEVGVSIRMVTDAWPWAMQCVMFLESMFTADERGEWEFILRGVPERLVVYGMPPKLEGALEYWSPETVGWPVIDLAFYRWRRVLLRQKDLDDKARQTKTKGGRDVVMAGTGTTSSEAGGASNSAPIESSPIESE